MNKRLAFVLSGGGARGALQVGALRALLEAGIRPDLLVGTSAGAINSAYLAVHGVNLASVESLAQAWHDAASGDLLTSNYVWATLSTFFNRSGRGGYQRMRDFFIAHGLGPELRFGDLQGVRLVVVAAELNCGCPVLYGTDPQHLVLDAVLASAALPPWVPPIEREGQILMDGGVVSNLPIEPAVTQGATEIITLELADTREIPAEARGWLPLLSKLRNMAAATVSNFKMMRWQRGWNEETKSFLVGGPAAHCATVGSAAVKRFCIGDCHSDRHGRRADLCRCDVVARMAE